MNLYSGGIMSSKHGALLEKLELYVMKSLVWITGFGLEYMMKMLLNMQESLELI